MLIPIILILLIIVLTTLLVVIKKPKKLLSFFALPFLLTSCGSDKCVISENRFFLLMDNIIRYPEEYINKELSLDCFTYDIKDVNDNVTVCGVRKCSAGYGCTCGRDTIIGFILNYEGEIPAAKNQYENSVEKTWIHISGHLANKNKTTITIYSYNADGTQSTDTEEVQFLTLNVESLELIEDYQNLHYYVTN